MGEMMDGTIDGTIGEVTTGMMTTAVGGDFINHRTA